MENKEKNICCKKTTMRNEEEKKKLINRLNRILGQVKGLKGMVERDEYCNDILIQSAAVSAAVSGFNRELLSSHMKGCVARDIKNGNDEVMDELLVTLKMLMK